MKGEPEPRNSPWAISITVRESSSTVMICCFKAVTLMEGTNRICCGADPTVCRAEMERFKGEGNEETVLGDMRYNLRRFLVVLLYLSKPKKT